MKKYKHLSLEEREQLFALREQELTFREIGEKLGRSHTSLVREYHRNKLKQGKNVGRYIPCKAQVKAGQRALNQRQKSALKSPRLYLYTRKKLRKGWSPETIAGRINHVANLGETIHHETIYRYIYNRKKTQKSQLWQYLTLHRKRRMRRNGRKVKTTRFEAGLSINNRSHEINQRVSVGHWETDNMEGRKTDQTSVSVTVERLSRYTLLSKLNNKKSSTKSEAVIKDLKKLPGLVSSLTSDRGPENAHYQQTSDRLNIPIYFCNPYHSWEKGSVENTIGRIRRFISKRTSVDPVGQRQLKKIQSLLNNTPRKVLNYLTPKEKLRQLQINSGALPMRM